MKFAAALLLLTLFAVPARADDGGMSVIRDAEIEHYLQTIGQPIFEAAGLPPKDVRFVMVDSTQWNAFVAGGMNIFLYTALLQATDEPSQLFGVIAHETGHISGGHLIRGRASMEQASTQALLATILGVAAGVAGRDASATGALITGGQQVAERSFLAFSRTQEGTADAAGMNFLDRAHLTSAGMLKFMQKLETQELLPEDRQSEYVRTHPLTQDRVTAIETHTNNSPYKDAPVPPAWIEMHKRMKAKLLGFMDPLEALQTYKSTDTSFPAQYARAIAMFKRTQLPQALALTDQLIAREPQNPYLYELKGQMLFESGKIADALPPYEKAVQLSGNAPLIEVAYAHALIESNDNKKLPLAIDRLQDAQRTEPNESLTWRLLATAWGRQGDEAMSSYALAEEAASKGDVKLAKLQIAQAEHKLPAGSPYRLKLLDLKADLQRIKNDQKDK